MASDCHFQNQDELSDLVSSENIAPTMTTKNLDAPPKIWTQYIDKIHTVKPYFLLVPYLESAFAGPRAIFPLQCESRWLLTSNLRQS